MMKELLRKEEKKTRVSANKDTNVGSSSHDPQQGTITLHCYQLVRQTYPVFCYML